MDALKFAFFFIGTAAFFVTVYFAVKHPKLVDSSGDKEPEISDRKLYKWDTAMTWLMWGGWACAAFIIYLDRAGVFDVVDK